MYSNSRKADCTFNSSELPQNPAMRGSIELKHPAGEALSKMLQNPGSRPDTMNSVEFSISIEVVFPLATNRTKDLYFSQVALVTLWGLQDLSS